MPPILKPDDSFPAGMSPFSADFRALLNMVAREAYKLKNLQVAGIDMRNSATELTLAIAKEGLTVVEVMPIKLGEQSGGDYPFKEQIRLADDSAWTDKPGGYCDTTTSDMVSLDTPAREIMDGEGTPADTVVMAFYCLNLDGERRVFFVATGESMRYAKVTGLLNEDDTTWTDFQTNKKLPSYCTANPSDDSIGTTIDTETTLRLKLNGDVKACGGWACMVDDIIGYLAGDSNEPVGAPPTVYDGYAIHEAGLDGVYWQRGRGVAFGVTLESTSGDGGTFSSPSSWVYNVKETLEDSSVVTLATGVTATWPQLANQMTAATYGIAQYARNDGSLVVLWANATPVTAIVSVPIGIQVSGTDIQFKLHQVRVLEEDDAGNDTWTTWDTGNTCS